MSKWLRILTWLSWLAAVRLLVIAALSIARTTWFLDQGIPPDLVADMQMQLFYDIPTAALLIFWPIWAMHRK